LRDDFDDLDTRRPGEFSQFVDVHFECFPVAPGRHRNQNRAFARADVSGRGGAGEFIFEITNPGAELEVELGRMAGRESLRGSAIVVGGAERRRMGQPRKAILTNRDRDDRVESQQSEVGQIVSCQPLGGQVRVDQAEAAQSAPAGAQATPIGELDARWAADHHVLDIAPTVDQHADLATDLRGQLGQCASEVVRDEAVCLEASSAESLEGLRLTRLEAAGIAVNLDRDGSTPTPCEGCVASGARVGKPAASGQAKQLNRDIRCPEGVIRTLVAEAGCGECTAEAPVSHSPYSSRCGCIAAMLRSRDGCKIGRLSTDQHVQNPRFFLAAAGHSRTWRCVCSFAGIQRDR